MNAAYVAVVDDEAPVRTALGRLLRLADYNVTTFASGEEFLDSLATRLPDCVVLDVHMPGLNGFDAQSTMRAAAIDVPVIFITASDDHSIDETARQAGCVCLLRKPFGSDTLLAAVQSAVSPVHRT